MAASYRSYAYDARPSLRDRIAASGLSGAIIGAIVLALLWVTAAPLVDMGSDAPLSTFDVAAPQAPRTTPRRQNQPKQQPRKPKAEPPPPRAEQVPPPPVPVPTVPGMIIMSREDFRRSDIAGIRSAPDTGKAAEVAESGDAKPVYGPSEMGGGRVLHAADWYREPTRAEMSPFMPPNLSEGWGMIACQTADRFRVENCRELGETPGSGIARGMRRASWQFLVRPPQVNGKPQLGAWVRIRFDIVQGIVK